MAEKVPGALPEETFTQNFIMIKGNGNPNDTDFSDRVSALYSLAYAIKMGYKSTAAKNSLSNGILTNGKLAAALFKFRFDN